ncbi:UDP-3-O-(3-hydroxymyristoyl)glucosamine N-acyltransferase [Desulfovibrio sp. OttesenSCG-928-C14]|nr:UDP-3-O-(3-hydroxymyristoyl)glucosamine N-acyltransferase [Desulfovibrio sp. OttesenSCG-928-C14]
MPDMTLRELAEKLGLTLAGDESRADAPVKGLNTLETAGPDEISFLANPKYFQFLKDTKALAVIISQEHASETPCALISPNPYLDFGRALSLFARPEGAYKGVSEQAFVHPEAQLGQNCAVYPFAFIGARAALGEGCSIFPGAYVGEDCKVGKNCVLYPGATLLSRTEIGDSCELFPGCVLGADGFGFTREGGGMQKIPQAGYVRLGSGVTVGANSAVDRGVLGATSLGDDSKLDNLVQVGHNVQIGREALLVSQVGIAGSCKIGDRVTIAGQAGLSGHIAIGNDVLIGPRSGVAKDVPDGFQGGGAPLVDGKTFLRTLSTMPKLPEMLKRIQALEKELDALKKALAAQAD